MKGHAGAGVMAVMLTFRFTDTLIIIMRHLADAIDCAECSYIQHGLKLCVAMIHTQHSDRCIMFRLKPRHVHHDQPNCVELLAFV